MTANFESTNSNQGPEDDDYDLDEILITRRDKIGFKVSKPIHNKPYAPSENMVDSSGDATMDITDDI